MKMMATVLPSLCLACAGLLAAMAWGHAAPSGQAGDPWPSGSAGNPPRVHDPSRILKCNGEYWVFCTGRGILSRRSRDLTHWEPGPPVFQTPPAWTTNIVPGGRGGFWAPDIIQLGKRYLLYYSVSTWGRKISAIGLATNATLDPSAPGYRWIDQGLVIQSGEADDFNAIDPAVTFDAQGNFWLAFGSYWSGIKLVQLNPSTGGLLQSGSPVYPLAHATAIEAACIQYHQDRYYLFVNWGTCCRGTNSTYNIRVGRSATIAGPYLDKDGKDLLQGGGSLLLGSVGRYIGPGHAGLFAEGGTNWLSCHFYDGARNGAPTQAVLPLRWTTDGWPESRWPAASGN